MSSLADNAPVFQNNDLVRLLDGGEPVRDGDDGPALHQPVQSFLDVTLGLGIQL